MTDRVNGLTVLLDRDFRDDDVRVLEQAIRQLRGVRDVRNIVVDSPSIMAEWRTKHATADEVMKLAHKLREDGRSL